LSASLVYGRRAGKRAAALANAARIDIPAPEDHAIPQSDLTWLAGLMSHERGPLQSDLRIKCQQLAHNKLGPIREDRTLREALDEYERIEREVVPAMRLDSKAGSSAKVRREELESALSVRNLALLGRILTIACLKRTESRGAHFRLDYPTTDDGRWRVVTRLQRGENDEIEFHIDPVMSPVASSARSEKVAAK